jgi:hypothetical protein
MVTSGLLTENKIPSIGAAKSVFDWMKTTSRFSFDFTDAMEH